MRPFAGDPIETQPERTRLSWQRTIVSLLIVVAVGGLKDVAEGQPRLTIALAIPGLVALYVMTSRQRQLRHGDLKVMTWQPVVVMACVIAMGIALIVASQL